MNTGEWVGLGFAGGLIVGRVWQAVLAYRQRKLLLTTVLLMAIHDSEALVPTLEQTLKEM